MRMRWRCQAAFNFEVRGTSHLTFLVESSVSSSPSLARLVPIAGISISFAIIEDNANEMEMPEMGTKRAREGEELTEDSTKKVRWEVPLTSKLKAAWHLHLIRI